MLEGVQYCAYDQRVEDWRRFEWNTRRESAPTEAACLDKLASVQTPGFPSCFGYARESISRCLRGRPASQSCFRPTSFAQRTGCAIAASARPRNSRFRRRRRSQTTNSPLPLSASSHRLSPRNLRHLLRRVFVWRSDGGDRWGPR